tara:strand:+ start:10317 stop:11381 length:1065 start_codon:yes stop_codon:yes gene_type:complete
MIVTEQDIRKALLKSLLEDDQLIKEFKLGAMTTSGISTNARCDFSDIPKEFFDYFKAIKDGNESRLVALIDNDIEKLKNGEATFFKDSNEDTIAKLENAKSDLIAKSLEDGGQSRRLERAQKFHAGKGWYGIATKLLLPLGAFGLSMMGFRKSTCDNIKLVAKTALNQVIAPLLGANIDTSWAADVKKSPRNNKNTGGKSYEDSTYQDFPIDFSKNLFQNNLIDRSLRKELVTYFDYEKYSLTNFDLDMFELYANDSYVNLSKNKKLSKDETNTAKHKIKFIKDEFKEKGVSFKAIRAVLGRYLDLDEAQSSRVNNYIKFLENFPFEDYFKDSSECQKFINHRFAVLLKFLKQF